MKTIKADTESTRSFVSYEINGKYYEAWANFSTIRRRTGMSTNTSAKEGENTSSYGKYNSFIIPDAAE